MASLRNTHKRTRSAPHSFLFSFRFFERNFSSCSCITLRSCVCYTRANNALSLFCCNSYRANASPCVSIHAFHFVADPRKDIVRCVSYTPPTIVLYRLIVFIIIVFRFVLQRKTTNSFSFLVSIQLRGRISTLGSIHDETEMENNCDISTASQRHE